ncbi:SDR family NAD(P)-dependent oxidoreductase [Flavobacteriaceae bacterium Ap0902]|nr:SDR family NAD(P)-dependent oxidoreductase [Flavobacteriaceae bacterium Ap0902]
MKYAFVTGVSSGIGKSTAEKFLKEGFYVFGSVRKPEHAEAFKNQYAERFHPLIFDITDFEAVDKAVSEIRDILQDNILDVFVNNAGVAKYGPIQHVPIEELRQQFEVNVFANVNLTQKVLPLIGASKTAKKKGKLFVISSTAGIMTRPMLGPYSASKHAIEAIYDALRREMMIYGIDVIIIEPGPIKTDIWGKAKKGGNPYEDTAYGKIFAQLDDAVDQIEKIGLPVNKVSDKIWAAYQSKKPKARYIVTPKKFQFIMAMYVLPAKKLDKIFFKEFKNLIK